MICLSGFSLFSQPALQALVHNVFYEDPGAVNLYLAGAALLIGLALIMYVDAKPRDSNESIPFLAANAGTMDIDDERRSLLSVSLYNGGGGGNLTPRRRLDLRSPRMRPQDMGGIPNINANLFYGYGTIGAGISPLLRVRMPPLSPTPYGSLRVRNSRQALGGSCAQNVVRDG